MNKQMQSFSFSSPINFIEEGKWLKRVSLFECTNSVFIITDENNSLSITIPGHWETESADKTNDELNKLIEIRSFELHVKEFSKKGKKIKLGGNEYKISDFGIKKKTRFLKN